MNTNSLHHRPLSPEDLAVLGQFRDVQAALADALESYAGKADVGRHRDEARASVARLDALLSAEGEVSR